jgi:hypothetical protein
VSNQALEKLPGPDKGVSRVALWAASCPKGFRLFALVREHTFTRSPDKGGGTCALPPENIFRGLQSLLVIREVLDPFSWG